MHRWQHFLGCGIEIAVGRELMARLKVPQRSARAWTDHAVGRPAGVSEVIEPLLYSAGGVKGVGGRFSAQSVSSVFSVFSRLS